ncbi:MULTISPECIES: DUF456 domain-containing protein [Streptomyces]|jgi:uncharacterized protein YqgC (DUF456 family)|uniref:DUF456 domain-containing protein n=1 Tax=Streptomyces TaxID=1883 RepID=UPI000A374F07|nr:DUF456 domain-containing protein [Streptomyces glaucescens]
MGVWELLLVGLVMLLGLCGVLLPGVPGSWLVWAAVMWWALTDPRPVAWWVLVGATVALFLSQVVRWALPPRRLQASGATARMAVYAGLGALLGFFLLPVLGAVPGFLGGIYLCERLRLGRSGEARAALRTAMRSGGWSVLAELVACLLIMGAWLGAVFLV